ncbi:MAG: glycosyl transferase [Gammaproteobacteria bacterium SG8_15]|nr:MAG: glycosyl transferase [Gammaproteobacteria bacterium SG8_15]
MQPISHNTPQSVTIVVPAKNEAGNLKTLLPKLIEVMPDAEIIVVNDGSSDDTLTICREHDIHVISHPYSMGNGASIKSGARAAAGDILVFMDGDGQHDPNDIPRLLEKIRAGYEMAVGARSVDTHASLIRRIGNSFYNKLASIMTGSKILDLTSGFRATRARHFRKFLYLLPNGFSYPTTSTMAFFRSGLPVAYVPIKAAKRTGKSKINLIKDGLRFFLIIIKIGALYSPMRFFLPISTAIFLTGLCYYIYTYINYKQFTNMSALLFTTSILVFLIGILSEQISSLHYKGASEDQRKSSRK